MNRQTWILVIVVTATLMAATTAVAQEESSSEAISQYRSAVALQNREMFDLAAEEWKAFIESHVSDPLAGKAHHYLGVCLFQQHEFAAAEDAFQVAIKSQSDAEQIRDSTLHLGLSQYNRGQNDDQKALQRCVETFESLSKRFANSAAADEALFYSAEALYALGDLEKAATAYQQALPHTQDTNRKSEILFGLGVTWQDLGKHQMARRAFEKLLQQAPSHALALETRMRRADTMLESEAYQAAAEEFRQLAGEKEFPFADYVQMRLAACQYGLRNYRKAAEAYAAVPKRFPKSEYVGPATLAAGKAFHLAKAPEEANTWLERAMKLGGDQVADAAHWLARSEIATGNPSRALKIIQSTLADAAGPVVVELRLDQADAMYELQGKREAASKLYARLAHDFPDHESAPHALYMAAYAGIDAKQYDRVLQFTNEFLQRYSDHELQPDVVSLRAESELQQEHYSAAQELYRTLLEQHLDHKDSALWLVRSALCLNLQGKHSQVLQVLQKKVNNIGDADLQSEARFLLGAAFYHMDQKPRAIAELKTSLAASPTTATADRTILLLAKSLRETGQPQDALTELKNFKSTFPESDLLDRALLEQAELYAEAGKHQQAAATYEELLDAFSDSDIAIDAIYGWGWSLLQAEDYQAAVTVFDKLIKMQVKHRRIHDAYYGRAVALRRTGQTDAALRDVEKYVSGSPTDAKALADAHYLKGLCLAGQQRYKDAAISFEQTLRTDPNYADADQVMYEWAWALDSDKQATKAGALFRKLAKQFPNSRLSAESVYRAAESDFAAKNYERAVRGFQSATKSAKQSKIKQQSFHKLGWAYYHLQKFDEARQAFEQQLRLSSDDELAGDAALMIGECHFAQDHFSEALAAFQSAGAALQQSTNQSLVALSLLHAGQSAAQLKKWSTSLEYLQTMVREDPESDYADQARYETAWALQNTGDKKQAATLYSQVADNTDSVVGARARFMLGELQFLDEDYPTAIRTFFKVAYGYGHPKAPEAYHTWQANAMFEAARCCESTKRFDAARRLYQDLIEFHPGSDKAEHARSKLAAIATR